MTRCAGLAVVWFAAAVGVGAAADGDAITFKFKTTPVGGTVAKTKTETNTTTTTIKANGKVQTKTEVIEEEYAYTQKVLARPKDGPPTKLARTYKTAERSVGGTEQDLGLAGETVLIAQKKDGTFSFSIRDEAVTGPAVELLGREFKADADISEKDFYPKGPVKPGDTWTVDAAKVAKSLAQTGMVVDPDKTEVTVKLVKVYPKNGRTYGVLDATIKAAVTGVNQGGKRVPLKDGSTFTVRIVGDGCIDGTLDEGTSEATTDGLIVAELPGAELTVTISGKGTKTTKEVTK